MPWHVNCHLSRYLKSLLSLRVSQGLIREADPPLWELWEKRFRRGMGSCMTREASGRAGSVASWRSPVAEMAP